MPTSSPPPGRPTTPLLRRVDHIDPSDELLIGALERAVVTARRDASTVDAPAPPTKLRPVLRFAKLPSRALQTVRAVLDSDDEFRARVAEGATEHDLGRASWLFLERPEGWDEEFELLTAAAVEESEDDEASRREGVAERRLAQVESTLESLRVDHGRSTAALDAAESALAEERAGRARLEADAAALSARLDELGEERAATVKHLKATEALATNRLDELRALRTRVAELEELLAQRPTADEPSDVAELPFDQQPLADASGDASTGDRGAPLAASVGPAGPEPAGPEPAGPEPAAASPWDGLDPTQVADAVARAAAASAALSDALADAARLLVPEPPLAVGPPDADAVSTEPSEGGDEPSAPTMRPPRRSPLRLRGGVHDGTAEGVEQLASTPGAIVIVDGYNVSMEGWPALDRSQQRTSLTRALGALRNRTGANVHVVFDGDDDGRRPSVGAPLPVRVHFSPADVEADDVILAMVAELPTDVPVVVASSDRRVAEGARRLGANVVRSDALLALLRR